MENITENGEANGPAIYEILADSKIYKIYKLTIFVDDKITFWGKIFLVNEKKPFMENNGGDVPLKKQKIIILKIAKISLFDANLCS